MGGWRFGADRKGRIRKARGVEENWGPAHAAGERVPTVSTQLAARSPPPTLHALRRRSEDDLTHQLGEIIKANIRLKKQDESGAPQHIILEFALLLQVCSVWLWVGGGGGWQLGIDGGGLGLHDGGGGGQGIVTQAAQRHLRRQCQAQQAVHQGGPAAVALL